MAIKLIPQPLLTTFYEWLTLLLFCAEMRSGFSLSLQMCWHRIHHGKGMEDIDKTIYDIRPLLYKEIEMNGLSLITWLDK